MRKIARNEKNQSHWLTRTSTNPSIGQNTTLQNRLATN